MTHAVALTLLTLAWVALVLAVSWLPRGGPSYSQRAVRAFLLRRVKRRTSDKTVAEVAEVLLGLHPDDLRRVVQVMTQVQKHGNWSMSMRTPEQNESIAVFSVRLCARGIVLRDLSPGDSDAGS